MVAGQWRKSRPCGPVTHSASLPLSLRRTLLKFPLLKSGMFYRQRQKFDSTPTVIKHLFNDSKYMNKYHMTLQIDCVSALRLWSSCEVCFSQQMLGKPSLLRAKHKIKCILKRKLTTQTKVYSRHVFIQGLVTHLS